MKPFFVLILTYGITLVLLKLVSGNWNHHLAGNIAMSVMLVFTAIGHFAYTRGMEMMLPGFFPLKKLIIYATGILEIAAATGLHIRALQHSTAILLIVFFIIILPSNIYAAVKKINYQSATLDGPGLSYLWFRIPFQLFLIGWVYFFNLYGCCTRA